MYFLLNAIITGVLGYFMPQWLYDATWQELVELMNNNTTSTKFQEFLKEIGVFDKTVPELARERFIISCLITIAIFIGMIILTKILKRVTDKNK